MEYIGNKERNDCIKTIRIHREWEREWERKCGDFSTSTLLFSPDGTRILSHPVQAAYVWDATSGRLIAGPLAGDNESGALSATYSPDGRYTIVISEDGIIEKWDTLTNCLVWKREIDKKQIDFSRVVSAAFSQDAKSVVFGNSQGAILVFNVNTGEQDGEPLEDHTDSVRCLSFSSDSQYFASGSDDTTIVIWDMDSRKAKTGTRKRHTRAVTAVNFSPSGNNVVSGSLDGTILVWDAFTGEVLREIACERGVDTVTYSPNGLLILAGGEKWMSMWIVVDVTTPPKVFRVDETILRVSFSPDGSRFVSVDSRHDAIRIWDASWSVEGTKTTIGGQGEITSIDSSPGGKFIVSGSADGSVYLWNVLSGKIVKSIRHSSGVTSIVFCPFNEKLIGFGSDDGTVQVWYVTNDEPVTIGNHMRSVTSVVFSPSDGTHLASGSVDETIRIWNVERRELEVGPLKGHDDEVTSIAYSPDGTRLASGSRDKTVRVWNSETGYLLSTLHGHPGCVNSVAYSSKESHVVSGSDKNTILVWDTENGQIVCRPITGHKGRVGSVCFSPDGKRILSGSWDNTARVWHAITGKPLFLPFKGHFDGINSICFFSDGTRFATGSRDGTIRIWTLDAIPFDTDWELRDDNWVVGKDGKLMMWVPKVLHKYLYRPRNTIILNCPFYLKLHFGSE